ncbi:uncharacterized protein LOC143465489 [Clavelina lepadiformis]|uniref:uncharacterized protein LOC143465489 n=1 Tax=Clavelina lepadiformis TaxID=159417 RepID=UPI0040428B20
MKTCVMLFAFLCFVLSVNADPQQQVSKYSVNELTTTAASTEQPTTRPTTSRKKITFDCTPYCRYNAFYRSRGSCPTNKRRRLLCQVCRFVLKCRTISSNIGP